MASSVNHPSYVELRLDRRIYRPGDLVTGGVTVVTSRPKRFDNIKVRLEGKTELEVSAKGTIVRRRREIDSSSMH